MANTRGVLYWLGAGASANAIPIVSDFTVGLQRFVGFLTEESPVLAHLDPEPHVHAGAVKLKSDLAEEVSFIAKEAETQLTIDTLARRYALLKEEGRGDLAKLKRVLATYFFYRELEAEQFTVLDADGQRKRRSFDKLDKRYDALLASILDEDTLKIPESIRFLSWNYDGQIELALARYIGMSKARSLDNAFYPGQYFKLNGGFSRQARGTSLYEIAHNKKDSNLEKILDFYDSLLHTCGHDPANYGIRFAWEKDVENEINAGLVTVFGHFHPDFASDLVVCGYSFPFYNHRRDEKILGLANGLFQRIILQYPKGEHDSVRERIKEIAPDLKNSQSHKFFGENGGNLFQYVENTTAFFIPLNAV